MELYKTVRNEAEAEQTVERSRFIAHVRPVSSKEEADEFIAAVKSEHRDATHNVPAMVIGDKSQIQWASDDGEPQGTSGAPIVQMLVSEGVTNVAIVVTRYFGGIKLGTGGLVRAYTGSAKLGLEAAGVCSVCEMCSVKIVIGYGHLDRIRSVAADGTEGRGDAPAFSIGKIDYTDKVTLDVIAAPEDRDAVMAMITNITSGTAQVLEEKIILEKV